VALLQSVFPNELLKGVIWLAILDANTRYILDEAHPRHDYAAFQQLTPDARRRPVSRSAIAQSLGIPFETCRRQIGLLLAQGLCAEVKGGLIVPARTLGDPRFLAIGEDNLANLRRLLRRLDAEADF